MNYTSIEQSKKLLELGLSPESADMAWIDRSSIVTDCPLVPVIMDIELESIIPKNKLIPCWSLGALLDFMPKYITEDNLTYIIRIIPTNDNKIEICYWDIYSGRIISNYIREETFLKQPTIWLYGY